MGATAVSLFSGIGGLDLGAALAGVRVRLATDVDDRALQCNARATSVPTMAGDIRVLLQTGALSRAWRPKTAPTLLIGGPPCTPFSHAGFWLEEKRNGQDPSADLLDAYVDAVAAFGPRAFVLENVPGLQFKTHRERRLRLERRARNLGYRLRSNLLDATAFGVPQARRRLFLVGTRDCDPPSLDGWDPLPARSSGWALKAVPGNAKEPGEGVNGDYGALLRRVPPGGNYLQFTERYGCVPPIFKNRGRYWSFLLKLDPNAPSPTLPSARVTYNGPFHWDSRHLRVREMARIQGFPDHYPLDEMPARARRHLGNAVPPAMAAAVVWQTLRSLGLTTSPQPGVDVLADPRRSCASAYSALFARLAAT